MGIWTIFDKRGTAKASVKELEMHDEWMAECYLSVSFVSATPVDFAIGDYIDYRGERYTIQYDPNVLKKASSGSYGEGFTYSNIKFVGLQDEIVRCDFNDIVLKDNNLHYTALPTFPFFCETVDDLLDRIQANLEELYPKQWTIIGLNTLRNGQRGTAVGRVSDFTNAYKKYIDKTGAANTESYGNVGIAETVDNITCWDALKKVHDDFGLNFIIRGRVIIVGTAGVFTANTFKYGKGNGLYEIERIGESEQQIVTRLRAYGAEDNLPSHYYSTINNPSSNLPNNMAVSRLMLPGFPNQSLAAWVKENKTKFDWLLAAVNEGFTFSTEAQRPYIESPNIGQYGVRPASIYFDGSNETDNIHPTIEGMKYNNAPIDEIYSADQIEDNGVYPAGRTIENINIVLPELGFELDKVYEEGASIDIKNGMCGARSFKIASVPTKNSDGRWVCNVERVYDDSLDLWFPYKDFQIKNGDKFVLTGISLPDAYVSSASANLLKAAIEALRKNHAPRYTYQPRIDEIWMQRQHDKAMASNDVVSLHDTLKAGDIFSFADADLHIDASIIIDALTIKENADSIPTYEVTLRDEKQVGTIQKIANKIDSVISGAVSINGAGGMSSRQVQSLIDRFGGEKFLSKLDDDTAQGFITMLQGLQVGDKFVPGLLGEGAIIRREEDGSTYIEADKLYVRMKAYFDSVETREYKHSAGNRVQSSAGNKCVRVEWIQIKNNKEVILEQKSANISSVSFFRCYFRASDGEDTVRNSFVIGDQVYCHITSVEGSSDDPEKKGLNQKHYWRLCVGRNAEGTLTADGEAWIDLSNKTSETLTIGGKSYTHAGCQSGSDIPEAQDSMIQLGNINDTTRQGAIIEFVTGANSPSYQIYQGINSFSLNGKNKIALGYNTKTGRAYMNVYGDTYIGDPDGSTFIRYNSATKELAIKAKVEILPSSTIDGSSMEDYIKLHQDNYDDTTVKQGITKAQNAADKAQESADDAQLSADEAAGAAKTADNKAVAAQKTADGAQKTADTATSAAKTADNKAVAAQKKADEAYDKAATFNYLSQALKSSTEIDGGLILSTLIALRDAKGNVWSGINGAFNENDETVEGGAKGHGIAAWFGGGMTDHEATPTLADFAKIIFRHDGSGYLAGGNISWDKTGKVTIKDIYTDVSGNEKELGTLLNDLMKFNNAFHFRLNGNNVLGIVPQVSFDNLSIAGKAVATEDWVSKNYVSIAFFNRLFQAYNNNTKVLPNDVKTTIDNLKLMVGTWTESYLSALGMSPDSQNNNGAAGLLDDLMNVEITDAASGEILQFDGTHWKNKPANFGVNMALVWQALSDSDSEEQIALSHLTLALSTLTGYTTSGKNYAVKKDSSNRLYVNVPWTDTKYTLPVATSSALGGIKLGYTTSGKNYAIVVDANGNAYVNVPWANTTYSAATQSAAGLLSAADKKKLDGIAAGANAYTLPVATDEVLGGIKVGYTTSGKNYAVQLEDGVAYVNVPWTDTKYTLPVASASALGGVKIGYATSGKNYAVLLDSNNKMYVNVPWTDTKYTLPTATASALGGIMIGYASSGKNYAVALSNGKAYVNVPWSDNSVTGVANHYTPSADADSELTAAISGTVGAYALNTVYSVITGIKLQRDAAGHVTGITYTAQNIKDTNTTYSAGTAALLTAGTNTTNRVWSAKILKDEINKYLPLSGGALTGTLTANDVVIKSANTLKIGDIYLAYDSENNAIEIYKLDGENHVAANLYARGGITALGEGVDGNNGVGDVTWELLENASDNRQIAISHLTTALTPYATQQWALENFNKFVLGVATADALGGVKIGYTTSGKNYAVQLDTNNKMFVNVPWTDTNTTYSAATQSAAGLMSAADKQKLDGIAAGANKYTYTLPTATASALGGIKIGYTTTGKNYAVQLSDGKAFVNVPWTDTNTTYSAATQSAQGLMSAADKKKLDGIAAGANAYVLPTATDETLGGIKVGYTTTGKNYAVQLEDGVAFVNVPWVNTTYSTATQSAAGLLSAADKKKLDGIAAGANAYTLPVATADTLGGVKIGYTASGKNYAVVLDSDGKMYVNVPWTNTTYSFTNKGATLAWGTTSTIATVGGVDIKVTMPANPNTWRGIQNNLTSDSTTDSLAAAQGKALKASITTLEGYFSSGVAKKAIQLNTARTLWGQSFNGTANVSGNMTGVGNITMASADGTFIQIGGIRIVYDSTNNALKVVKSDGETAANFYATGGLSALGESENGSNGAGDVTWDLLADGDDKRQIASSHLSNVLAGLATEDWVRNNFTNFSLGVATANALGGVKVGYTTSGKNYAVQLDSNNKMFVNVPWSDTNTTYSAATQSAAGLMSAADKAKLDGIATGANKYTYTLPTASASVLGGIKIGYTNSGKNYAVLLDSNGVAYVNVPWTDNNTTYSVFSATANGLVPMASTANKTTAETAVGNYYLCADGKFRQLPANAFKNDNTTYTFTNKGATLAWGATSTIATVGGVDIKVTMPANPNTDHYAWSDITGKPSTFTPSEHTHNYLPLSGGKMSGEILFMGGDKGTRAFGIRLTNTNKNIDLGWNWDNRDGATIALRSTDQTNESGAFHITARNATQSVQLAGGADGKFTWGGSAILTAANTSVTVSGSTLTVNINGTSKTFTNTWRGIQDNLTSSANTTESLSAKQGYLLANGSARDNTKLPLAGGTLTNGNAVISRVGNSVTWVNGRKFPIIKSTSYTGYNSILSMKTTNGSWDLGVYTNDTAYLTYITDANYNEGTNTTTYQIAFPKASGTLALTSQIPTTLPASDVYAWAKAASKPSYSWSEITGKPTTFTPSAHTHDYLPLTGGNLSGNLIFTGGGTEGTRKFGIKKTVDNKNIDLGWDWSAKDGAGAFFRSVDYENGRFGMYARNASGTTSQLIGNPGGDLKWGILNGEQIVLHEGNYNSYAPKKDGTGASGTWGIGISGNAATATKLATACTLWGQSFNGTANISGNMSGVGNITMATTDGTFIQLGDIRIVYDSTNSALKIVKSDGKTAANLYATGGLSSLGLGIDEQSGVGDVTWELLADDTDSRQVSISHISMALDTLTSYVTSGKNYAVQKDSNNRLFVNVPWTDHYAWSDITGKPSTFAPSAHNHASLNGPDNRSVNNTPSWYMSNVGKASIYTEFCQTGGAKSTHENRTTFTPWGDQTGQRPVQLAFNNSGMFMRTSASDTAWNAWQTIITSSNISSYLSGIGGSIDWSNITNRPDPVRHISDDFNPTTNYGYWAGMTTNSGITADWWHVINLDWSGGDNWRSQLALPTNGRRGVYYRSDVDTDGSGHWKFGGWKRLLDTDDLSSIGGTYNGGNISGTFSSSSTVPLRFTGIGSGTYDVCEWYCNSDGITLETPRATDSPSATSLPFMIKTRGGQYATLRTGNLYAESTLYVKDGYGITSSTSGNGLLVYHPLDWTGVASNQWGAGAVDSQGVIRSSNTDLVHYRYNAGSYTIWDSANFSPSSYLAKSGGDMDSGARISFSGGYGYIGNANNAGWLLVQDMCSMNSAGDGIWSIRTNGNAVFANVTSNGSLTALSDARHKIIIKNTYLTVNQIANMPSILYKWNDGRKDDNLYAGSLAQNWKNVLPEVVRVAGDAEGTLSMDYGVAALVSVITTARKVVDHERRIKELEKENERLRTEIEQIRLNNN